MCTGKTAKNFYAHWNHKGKLKENDRSFQFIHIAKITGLLKQKP